MFPPFRKVVGTSSMDGVMRSTSGDMEPPNSNSRVTLFELELNSSSPQRNTRVRFYSNIKVCKITANSDRRRTVNLQNSVRSIDEGKATLSYREKNNVIYNHL